MDKDKNNILTYDEFIDGSKQDPAIAKVIPSSFRGVFSFPSPDTATSGSNHVRWFCVTMGLEGQEYRLLCFT